MPSQSMCVRFATDDGPANPIALAAGAIAGVIAQCQYRQYVPTGVLSIAIGPGGDLVDLFEKVKGEAEGPDALTIANEDQVRATFTAEPGRFAAMAFAWCEPIEEPT